VEVPPADALYPEEFTIEAWVFPQWGGNYDTGYEHTLFSAGGHYRRPLDPGSAAFHGFAVVADRNGRWQVRFYGGGDLFPNPPLATQITHAPTHLALTVTREGSLSRARLFVNGKEAAPASAPAFYSPPRGAPLLIGVNSTQSDALLPVVPTRPIISMIQEVVLHSQPLSAAEIENHVDINRVA
jgi:concanavalin A-like lectin/glucanase superfamily protein